MATIEVEQTKTVNKIEPWDLKELKKNLKANKEFYKKVAGGLHVVPPSEQYLNETKTRAQQLLDKIEAFEQKYELLHETTENKRSASIKPRVCDQRLTNLLYKYFKRYLPEIGNHGVCDLNRLVPRAISLIVKQKGLGDTNFFTLDDELTALFNSPSIEDPSKTYVQLLQERIAEIRSNPKFKHSPSSAEIMVAPNRITMNYSALKIIIPKFAVNYDLTDVSQYIPPLEEFAKHLDDLYNQDLEAKKAAKKAKKAEATSTK